MDQQFDRWENLIRRRRHELDDAEPVRMPAIWRGITDRLEGRDHQKEDRQPPTGGWQLSIGRYWRWSIAATIALAAGLYWYSISSSAPVHPLPQLADYYPDLAQEEQQYQRLIAQKKEALNFEQLSRSDYESIFEELALLENIHQQYLADLPHYQNNDQLVKTLIKYYEHKIRILERLSLEIDKKKRNEERERETEI